MPQPAISAIAPWFPAHNQSRYTIVGSFVPSGASHHCRPPRAKFRRADSASRHAATTPGPGDRRSPRHQRSKRVHAAIAMVATERPAIKSTYNRSPQNHRSRSRPIALPKLARRDRGLDVVNERSVQPTACTISMSNVKTKAPAINKRRTRTRDIAWSSREEREHAHDNGRYHFEQRIENPVEPDAPPRVVAPMSGRPPTPDHRER
jgi:hypothetical protein